MKEAGVRAVKFVEAIHDVLGGMGVYNVEHHVKALGVSRVNQFLQLFRGAITAGEF